mmetsp:Transcript_81505/g.236320  ORF Transcript_81505/g.236320 Transcript_81505/m.236320 type:complete len:220 (-) Transcript_81505:289-948(-)
MALSSKPFGWNTSLKCATPLSASGSRPAALWTPSAGLAASTRPKRVGTSGPPMTRMAIFAARAQRSAWDTRKGQYLLLIGSSNDSATDRRPALAGNCPSPPPGSRSAAFGQPPANFPCEKTPASCQDKRIRIGPQFLAFTSFSRSLTKFSYDMPRTSVISRDWWLLHAPMIAAMSPLMPFTSMMLSPILIFLSSGDVSFHCWAKPGVTAMMGNDIRCAM